MTACEIDFVKVFDTLLRSSAESETVPTTELAKVVSELGLNLGTTEREELIDELHFVSSGTGNTRLSEFLTVMERHMKVRARGSFLREVYQKQPYTAMMNGGIEILVDKDVFPPDTGFAAKPLQEAIVDFASKFDAETLSSKVGLDMGCGTGYLALIMRKQNVGEVWALDVHNAAVECTRANLEKHPELKPMNIMQSNLFSAVPAGKKFDLIAFNQPFYPVHEENPPFGCNPDDGKNVIERFFEEVRQFMHADSKILMPFHSIAGGMHNPVNIGGPKGFTSRDVWFRQDGEYALRIVEFGL